MAPQTQTRTIVVKVDTPSTAGLKEIATQMKVLNQEAKVTSNSLNTLKTAFLGLISVFGLGLGVKQLIEISDTMQLLTDRLTILTGSSKAAQDVLGKLASVAEVTKSRIDVIADVYAKLTVATRGLGLSSDAILSTIEVLEQTFRLSGATQEQAAAQANNLARAFSLGALKGRQLREVLLNNGTLAAILRDEIGKTGKTVEQFGKDGLITTSYLLGILSKHFDEINGKASKLTTTFGQTITVAINKFSLAVGRLNEEFKLSDKFADFVDTIVNNGPTIAAILGGLALTTIPLLIAAIERLTLAAIAFTVSNPLTLYLQLIGTAILLVVANFERLKLRFEQIVEGSKFLIDIILSKVAQLTESFGKLSGNLFVVAFAKALKVDLAQGAEVAGKKVSELQDKINNLGKTPKAGLENNIIVPKDKPKALTLAEQIKLVKTQIGELNAKFNEGGIGAGLFNKSLDGLNVKLLNLELRAGKIDLFKFNEGILKIKKAELGREFDKGAINATQFAYALRGLNLDELKAKLDAGKISLFKFNEEQIKSKREDFESYLEGGIISLNDFNAALKNLQLEEITNKFKAGKVSVLEYNEAILKLGEGFLPGSPLSVGITQYIESSGTFAQNVAKNVTLVFNTLEDNLVNFIKTGTFEFKKFAQSILDDINRIILRAAIVQPLANGIQGLFAPGQPALAAPAGSQSFGAFENTTGVRAAAKGYAPNGSGVSMFANGGIVSGATPFSYNGGKPGVMGEAGDEAILPLTRGPNGKLGVNGGGSNVQVNIINQTGGEVSQTESTDPNGSKVIDILITNKIKDSFANGSLDKTMANLYNVRRKGG